MPVAPGESDAGDSRDQVFTDAHALIRYLGRVLPQASASMGGDPTFGPLSQPPREAAVLLPIYARAGVPYLLFTLRSPTLAHHSGQISFPGGSRDPADADVVATALRETHEEIGLPPSAVRKLGVLSPVFTVVSNFLIAPVVGWIDAEPLDLSPNPGEVAEVIEVPLATLADPAIFHEEIWQRASGEVTVYFYDYGTYRIWGATARIVHDFLRTLPGGAN